MEITDFNEKDGKMDKPTQWGKPRKINVTTSISNDIWTTAKENKISWNDALEFGVMFLIADKEGIDYPKNNLQEKLHKIVLHRNALLTEVSGLREQVPTVDDVDDEAIDDILTAEVTKDE